MNLRQRILRIQETALCFVRKWWRPAACVGLASSVWVNLVFIPLKKMIPVEFASASVYVTSIVAAFAVREFGKWKGSAE